MPGSRGYRRFVSTNTDRKVGIKRNLSAVSGPSEMYLGMGAAARLDAVFGARRSDELAPGEETSEGTESGGSEESGSALSGVLRWGARISGILMLVLAVGVAVVFVLSRRQ